MRVRPSGHHLTAGFVLAAMTAAAGLWGVAPAAASSGVTLHYTCTLGALPSQAMTARIVWHAPPAVTVGRTTPTVTVTVTATVGATVTFGLGVVGAATVEGSVDAPGTVVAPEGHIGAALRLTVPRTGVPSSGPMTVPATGTTPGLVFHQPGHATVTVDNNLALHFTPRDASGNPTSAGSVDLSCTLDPGQNTVVFAFDIAPAPVTIPTTRAAHSSVTATRAAVAPVTTPPSTTAVSATAGSTVSETASPIATTARIRGLATATAVVRTVGPTGVGWWLAIAGALVVGGCGWWLIRRRHRRVSGR